MELREALERGRHEDRSRQDGQKKTRDRQGYRGVPQWCSGTRGEDNQFQEKKGYQGI